MKKLSGLLLGMCLSIVVGCTPDSEMVTDKELLFETLAKGSWQVNLRHSVSGKILEHSDIQLKFLSDGGMQAKIFEETSEVIDYYNGTYALIYEEDERPIYDDEYYVYSKCKGDLIISMAFYKSDLIIFNDRWYVKSFTANTVILQADDIVLVLQKSN